MRDVYRNIKEYRQRKGLTQGELAKRMGYADKSMISRIEGGKVDLSLSKVRAFAKVLDVDPVVLMGSDWSENEENSVLNQIHISSRIPVYSAAGAGKPQPTSDDILFYADYNGDPDGVLGVQIKGDSMAPTIPDNSLVIVNSNLQIESGDIVVAQVNSDHEALCKRVKKYKDGLSLISDNPAYPPLYFTAQQVQELPVRFVGKCTEVRKKL